MPNRRVFPRPTRAPRLGRRFGALLTLTRSYPLPTPRGRFARPFAAASSAAASPASRSSSASARGYSQSTSAPTRRSRRNRPSAGAQSAQRATGTSSSRCRLLSTARDRLTDGLSDGLISDEAESEAPARFAGNVEWRSGPREHLVGAKGRGRRPELHQQALRADAKRRCELVMRRE